MTKLHREIFGRATMLVVGIALLYAGNRCFEASARIEADNATHEVSIDEDGTAAGLPHTVGLILILLGGPLVLGAVLPVAYFAKVMDRSPV
jgi:hypothetical protein